MRAVAQMGYQCVEFYAPYFEWSDAQAKQMRKVLMSSAFIAAFDTQRVGTISQRIRSGARGS